MPNVKQARPSAVPLFDRLLVFGVGLLGGSVALAAKKWDVARSVLGFDLSEKLLAPALKRKIIDKAYDFEAVRNLDLREGRTLAVFCLPVGVIPAQVASFLNAFPRERAPDLLVTDTGSTKATISLCTDDPRFIGSHPIAGGEKSGPIFAKAELFKNRTTVIAPGYNSSLAGAELLRDFWKRLGSRVVFMTPETHDAVLAVTSHLPHAISTALASLPDEYERSCTGTGFESMTRLAEGGADIWTDILFENGENVALALERFQDRLSRLREILETQDRDALRQFLEEGKRKGE